MATIVRHLPTGVDRVEPRTKSRLVRMMHEDVAFSLVVKTTAGGSFMALLGTLAAGSKTQHQAHQTRSTTQWSTNRSKSMKESVMETVVISITTLFLVAMIAILAGG